MGRVRFYSPEGDRYVSLRVDDDGLWLDGHKLTVRKVQTKLPPKKQGRIGGHETSIQYAARLSDPDLLAKILTVLNDFEQTMVLDDKAMVSVKSAYKNPGYQIGVFYSDIWSNFTGSSVLETLVKYFDEVLAEDDPPPLPPRKGGGSTK